MLPGIQPGLLLARPGVAGLELAPHLGAAPRRRGILARRLSAVAIAELEDGTYAEYYHALTGEPLGSHNQSWTAAVALDWLLAND